MNISQFYSFSPTEEQCVEFEATTNTAATNY